MLVSSAQMFEKKEPQEGEQNGNENEAAQPQSTSDEANASQESQSSTGESMDTTAPAEVCFVLFLSNYFSYCWLYGCFLI